MPSFPEIGEAHLYIPREPGAADDIDTVRLRSGARPVRREVHHHPPLRRLHQRSLQPRRATPASSANLQGARIAELSAAQANGCGSIDHASGTVVDDVPSPFTEDDIA